MYFILYKTKNLINGKYYIGIHKQKTLEFDGYYGSGLLLHQAIEKYGKENFEREILHTFCNWDDARKKEKEIVTESFCRRKSNYNISVGGQGGYTMAGFSDEQKEEVYRKAHETKLKTGAYIIKGKKLKRYQEQMRKIRIQPNNKGRKHSEKSKANFRKAQQGYKYITNGKDNRKIKDDMLPEGWKWGRTIPKDKRFKGHDKETVKRMAEERKGKKYYNNGKTNKLLSEEQFAKMGDEWVHGLLHHVKDKRMFITDGIQSRKILLTDTIPEGWRKGRTFNVNRKRKDK